MGFRLPDLDDFTEKLDQEIDEKKQERIDRFAIAVLQGIYTREGKRDSYEKVAIEAYLQAEKMEEIRSTLNK